MASSRCKEKHTDVKYVYNLPFFERFDLCKILNQIDKWEELAGNWMKYDALTIQILRTEQNPTHELLTLWGHDNHTVLELFVLLSRMEHYRAMLPLKPFVEQRFHALMDNGEGNLQRIFGLSNRNQNSKDLKIGVQNFNQNTPTTTCSDKRSNSEEYKLKKFINL